jgi:hypothetical protein
MCGVAIYIRATLKMQEVFDRAIVSIFGDLESGRGNGRTVDDPGCTTAARASFCLPMTKLGHYGASTIVSRIRPVAGVGLNNHNTQDVT